MVIQTDLIGDKRILINLFVSCHWILTVLEYFEG